MKLRNKKTGETGYLELEKGDDEKYTGLRVYKNDFMYKRYDSLAGVLEEWEDYAPQEPLIDNEEIRDIIRAWADVNDAMVLKYNHDENSLDDIYRNTITFNMGLGLEDGRKYTITELCGEEEEC